jgi:hypothetical protein
MEIGNDDEMGMRAGDFGMSRSMPRQRLNKYCAGSSSFESVSSTHSFHSLLK